MTDERLSLLRQLRELGHRVAVADFKEADLLSDKRRNIAKKFGRLVKVDLPIRAEAGNTKEVHPNIMWARDSWKKIGPRNRVNFFQKDGSYQQLGEGGMSVDLPGKIILAAKNLAGDSQVQRLTQQGYKFVFLNDGYVLKPNLSRMLKTRAYVSWNHVDTFVGATGKVMLVDHEFFANNRSELRQAAKQSGLEIVFIPEAETHLYPANFLPLGENTVLMDKQAKQTIQLLTQHGVKVIPTKVTLSANRESGGGVRCILNEL